MRALLALVLLAGCATTAPYSRALLGCQDQAVDLVWRQQYGRADRAPDVYWVPREAQTCGRVHANGARGFPAAGSTTGCAGSVMLAASAVALVDYGEGWQGTGLAHEDAHAAQARDGLPPDMAHTSAPFQPGGAVARANAALAAARLCGP